MFQSTLPRGERLKRLVMDDLERKVSIHAPTRGATLLAVLGVFFIFVSIHAPTRGATQYYLYIQSAYLFQSTLPRGERPEAGQVQTWIRCFNPRSHEGSDTRNQPKMTCAWLFQSTLPRGERLMDMATLGLSVQFQSTLPRGERLHPLVLVVTPLDVSIHAPTRGATAPICFKTEASRCFNPRSHEGSDCTIKDMFWNGDVSIHAPTRGATLYLFI